MIDTLNDLKPETPWSETVWAHTSEESLTDHETEARLCVATLLPFSDGKPDWEGFVRSVRWMISCGDHYGIELVFVLNADTGFIFQLSPDLYREVIARFRGEFPDQRIICGVTATGASGDSFSAEWYFPQLDVVQEYEDAEAMIMTSRQLNQLGPEARRDAYFEIAEHITIPAIVHCPRTGLCSVGDSFRAMVVEGVGHA